jgi:hypothetical protein
MSLKGEENLVNEGSVPAVCSGANEIFNHREVISCLLPAPDLKSILMGEPIVFPYIHLFTITNGPYTPFLEDPSSLHDASPSVATSVTKFCLHEVTIREVLSLQDPSNQGLRLSGNPPPLFG